MYLCLVLTKKYSPLNKLVGRSTDFEENISFYEFLTNINGIFNIFDSEVFQSSINSCEIVSFSFKLLFCDPLINMHQILLAY